MNKSTTLFFTTLLLLFITNLKAQTGGFASAAANKSWAVSKYYTSFTQEDKKDLFQNFSFKFFNGDTTTFLAIDNSKSLADTCQGFWREDGDKVGLFLNIELSDKENYRTAVLLNQSEMKKVEISPSKLRFRIPDMMGYIDVEFTEK